MSSNYSSNRKDLEEILYEAPRSITSAIAKADRESDFPMFLNKIFLCSVNGDGQYLLKTLEKKLSPG